MTSLGRHSFGWQRAISAATVMTSLLLSIATWFIYVAAHYGILGDEAELPFVLLVFGTPVIAGAGVIMTIRNVELIENNVWRWQFTIAIVCGISAILAVAGFFVLT